MTLKPQLAADRNTERNAADRNAAAITADTFVINLCSSTTPMALVHPDAPELKRFRFFVSRRLEDGRERFRLHMGHFESLEEAEDWLSVVRDIYPGAWAGEAPGKRLRAQAASAPPLLAAAPPEPMSAPLAPSVANIEPPLLAPALPPLPAAAGQAALPVAVPERRAPAAPGAQAENVVVAAPLAAKRAPTAPIVAQRRDSEAAPRPARAALKAPLSNVREVLAALDDSSPRTPPAAAPGPAARAAQAAPTLSDTQVMQILEARRTDEPGRAAVAAVTGGGIPLLRPDDSGTRRALKEAVRDNAAVSFAVQLQWSVDSMALDKVPPLAIFSAYTLYTVEGNRDGRKWYGLRLGFFGDANAAKQVAQYVRSDFASVAVVPVSPQERGHASSADRKTSAVSFPEVRPARESDEFKLLDEPSEPAAPRVAASAPGAAKTGSAAARAAATRSKSLRSKERTAQRKSPYSLEETLEILGAGNLEIDHGRGELINESGVRHLKVEVRKNSPFQRLVARLTERVRKG